jgi:glycosyltransferase involved in cell wall biosynthesis
MLSPPMRAAMPIAINGRFLTQKIHGVQRFASEVTKAIDRLLDDPAYAALRGHVEIVTPHNGVPLDLRHIPVRHCGRLEGYAWEQIELPIFARGSLLLNLCLLGPIVTKRQVVVAHDASVRAIPDNFSWQFRAAYDFLVPRLLRSDRVVSVSDFSRHEIGKYYGVEIDRIPVCYEGADHITAAPADTSILSRLDITGRRYLLGVGIFSRNKNYENVLAAFNQAALGDTLLVVTGSRDGRIRSFSLDTTSSKLVMAGYVSDAELRALYENALALVYPSRYEGFGLPPVEAMQCGCPVIISDQPALVEMAGDAALRCGMDDVAALAGLMQAVHSDAELRARMKQASLERARRFTWAETARILLEQCIEVGASRAA